MAAKLVVSGVIFGAVVFTLTYLFEQYPAERTNWDSLMFYRQLLMCVAGGLICAGVVLALRNEAGKKRRRIAYLSSAIGLVATFAFLGSPTTKELPKLASGRLSDRYEFTTDWVSGQVLNWEKSLSPLKGKPDIQALEVGSFEGRSAIWFLENVLTHPSASLTCVDTFDVAFSPNGFEDRFDRNIASSGVANRVIKIKARSDDALKKFKPESFDFIYVDGSHIAKDVLVDAVLAWETVKPDGIIIFDDYDWGRSNKLGRHRMPMVALDAFLDVYGPYIDVLHKDYQLIVRKRSTIDLDDDGKLGEVARRIQRTLF